MRCHGQGGPLIQVEGQAGEAQQPRAEDGEV
jgi:hypothetical protein